MAQSLLRGGHWLAASYKNAACYIVVGNTASAELGVTPSLIQASSNESKRYSSDKRKIMCARLLPLILQRNRLSAAGAFVVKLAAVTGMAGPDRVLDCHVRALSSANYRGRHQRL